MIPEPRVAKSSGCNNRSKDDHSFLKSQDFLCGDFFVSSVSSHNISVRDNSKLVFISNPENQFHQNMYARL